MRWGRTASSTFDGVPPETVLDVARASVIRLIYDPPLDGPTNMARDECLLTGVGAGRSGATFRLYRWDPPTVSLGYFQRYRDYEALPKPLGDLPVVRRLTGGGAILHDLELTYSLTLPLPHPLLLRGPNCLYELVHDAVIVSLRAIGLSAARADGSDGSGPTSGPFFCFARRHRYDLVIGPGKVAGSAQRRTRTAILQHGSIILADRLGQPGVASLSVAFGDAIQSLCRVLPEELGRLSDSQMQPTCWSKDELSEVDALVEKYAGSEWTRRM